MQHCSPLETACIATTTTTLTNICRAANQSLECHSNQHIVSHKQSKGTAFYSLLCRALEHYLKLELVRDERYQDRGGLLLSAKAHQTCYSTEIQFSASKLSSQHSAKCPFGRTEKRPNLIQRFKLEIVLELCLSMYCVLMICFQTVDAVQVWRFINGSLVVYFNCLTFLRNKPRLARDF